ncbi:MAG: sigma 54-interacting transcriptional regulator [Desulfobacterales bacterium]|nr:MAG: sigma 54-interacting transcriptional regulator [Desulfobacterales bacterium]
MSQNLACAGLERIAVQMTSSLSLQEVLNTITEGLIETCGATFARIWLITPLNGCRQCRPSSACADRAVCLQAMASAGRLLDSDQTFHRHPVGSPFIDRIAANTRPMTKKDLPLDGGFPDVSWIQANGFRSFALHTLIFRDELMGIMGLFCDRLMSQAEFDRVVGFANHAAIAIKNAQLFSEVEGLKNRLQAENIYLQEEIKLEHNFEQIIGASKPLKDALKKVEHVAATDATVLIVGETGTGKELLARAIHQVGSRRDRPLIKVNCAAIQPTLMENEFFGHEPGAFTGALARKMGRFELADGGTIFLDEIGDLPFELQGKLLRVLQEGELDRVGGTRTISVDVRVIASTNHDLERAMKSGRFREDLFYRLNVFPIRAPALRDRKDDIPLLVEHFIQKYGSRFGKNIRTVPRNIMQAFLLYEWPGNIRELENVIERAVILSDNDKIGSDAFFDWRPQFKSDDNDSRTLRDVERTHILRVLKKARWIIEGKRGAATRLGIHPATLRSRMQRLGIKRPQPQ